MSTWRALILGTVLALSAGAARAGQNDQGENNDDQGSTRDNKPRSGGHGVPEIGSLGIGGAIAVVVGGALLIGARRARKRSAG
jgi:hypothetical protein